MLGCIAMEFHEGTDAAECDIAHSLLLGEGSGNVRYLYAYAEGKHCCGPDFRMDGVQQPAE